VIQGHGQLPFVKISFRNKILTQLLMPLVLTKTLVVLP
jgi:hypothetical protein